MLEFLELSAATLAVIALAAFLTGALHGATGMAGGVTMAAILSYILGIKVAIPVTTCALIFSHASRTALYWRDTDWKISKRVLLFGLPMTVVGALIFTVLDPKVVALVFAGVLALSFPIKYWARRRGVKTGPKLLAFASSIWGMLAGNVTGPGFFLAPFLLGTGMNRLTFVGTLATITLVMNVVKLSVFGVTEFMNVQLFLLGVIIGLITIPANWSGRMLLKRMSDKGHGTFVDVLTLIMIVNFVFFGTVYSAS